MGEFILGDIGMPGLLRSKRPERKILNREQKMREIEKVLSAFEELDSTVNTWVNGYFNEKDARKQREIIAGKLESGILDEWIETAEALKQQYVNLMESEPISEDERNIRELMRKYRSKLRMSKRPLAEQDAELTKYRVPTTGQSMVQTGKFQRLLDFLEQVKKDGGIRLMKRENFH
jgi:hypothetical protein